MVKRSGNAKKPKKRGGQHKPRAVKDRVAKKRGKLDLSKIAKKDRIVAPPGVFRGHATQTLLDSIELVFDKLNPLSRY